MRLYLEFVPGQGTIHRHRLTYAFRLFCAIWNHVPVLSPAEAASCDATISYKTSERAKPGRKTICLGNYYYPRIPQLPAPPPKHAFFDEEATWLFYEPRDGSAPDWLGEIFEWVSCADEYSIGHHDSIGRIPFSTSYVGRHGLDVCRPYAAIAMRLLQNSLLKLFPRQAGRTPASQAHFIINTHDVDFLPLSGADSFRRLLKNAAVSLLVARSPGLALAQVGQASGVATGSRNVLDQLPALLEAERRRSVSASYFFISYKGHRRDANYDLSDPRVMRLMRKIEQTNEVGVHASYTSLDHEHQLAHEFGRLQQLGFHPIGSRQHWLRFTLDQLIPALECAGAQYDCSLGWTDRVGFRAGASFPFPPYDFKNERPAKFIEFPLVLMDQMLQGHGTGDQMLRNAAAALSASRANGWGGISVLWHPTAFGGGQLPEEIGRLFWKLIDLRTETNDVWTSAARVLPLFQERFRGVGLLSSDTPFARSELPAILQGS